MVEPTEISLKDGEHKELSEFKSIAPTILIGLGGTGKEVLMLIRRFFYERYKVIGFPIVGYLWIDTDPNYQAVQEQQSDDFITSQIQFTDEEKISAVVPQAEYMSYFKEPQANHNIFKWLSFNLRAYGNAGIVKGAYQVRPLGKLAFYHFHDKISNRIKTICNNLRLLNIPEMMRQYDVQVDTTNTNIYIISSIAGGTGSGMLLDTGFLVNNVLMQDQPKITSFIALPTIFGQLGQRDSALYFANAYATLKELNYYYTHKPSFSKPIDGEHSADVDLETRNADFHNYTPNWENSDNPEPVIGPPFHNCYLIDNQNKAGRTINPDKRFEIFNMISEKIFLDFEKAQFSEAMRSANVNTLTRTLDDYPHTVKDPEAKDISGKPLILYKDVYPCRYASIGLSKIFVDLDRLKHAASYYLAGKLTDLWIMNHKIPGSFEDIVKSNISELGVSRMQIEKAIAASDAHGNELYQVLNNKFEQHKAEFLNRVSKHEDFVTALDKLKATYVRQFHKPSDDPNTWGTYIKVIEKSNRSGTLSTLTANLSSERNKLLNDAYTGFDLTEEYLKAYAKNLHLSARSLNANAEGMKNQASNANKEFSKYRNRILEIQRSWSNNVIFHRNGTLKILLEKALDCLKRYFQQLAYSFVFHSSSKICNELVNRIGEKKSLEDKDGKTIVKRSGLIQENWKLQGLLTNLNKRLKNKFESFKQAKVEDRNTSLTKDFDFQTEVIDAQRGEEEEFIWLTKLADKFFDESEVGALSGTKTYLNDIEHLEENLLKFCFKNIGDIGKDLDALELFFNNFAERTHRENKIQATINMSDSWLPPALNQPALRNTKFVEQRHFGLNRVNSSQYKEFVNIVQKRNSAIARTGNYKESIIFYSETAGFPLFYIRDIEKWRATYLREIQVRPEERHNELDWEKFNDLIPPDQKEAQRLIEANEVFLLGVILRIIRATDKGNFFYEQEEYGITDQRLLGSKVVAIQTLKAQDQQREIIMERIETSIQQANPNELLDLLGLLTYYTRKIFPIEWVLISRTTEDRRSPEYTCLEKRRVEIYNNLRNPYPKEKLENKIRAIVKNVDDVAQKIKGTELYALKREIGKLEETEAVE